MWCFPVGLLGGFLGAYLLRVLLPGGQKTALKIIALTFKPLFMGGLLALAVLISRAHLLWMGGGMCIAYMGCLVFTAIRSKRTGEGN